jgi:hypothetical protein
VAFSNMLVYLLPVTDAHIVAFPHHYNSNYFLHIFLIPCVFCLRTRHVDFICLITQRERQYTCNVNLRRVLATIISVSKQ